MITIKTKNYTEEELFMLSAALLHAYNTFRNDACNYSINCTNCKHKTACTDLKNAAFYVMNLSDQKEPSD